MFARSRFSVVFLAGLGLAVLAEAPVVAQNGFSFPCSVDPADNSAENGVGAESGAEPREFCSILTIPSGCTLDGYYLIGAMSEDLTRTTGSATMTFTNLVRTAPLGGGPPTSVVAGPFQRQAFNVPAYPSTQSVVRDLIDVSTGQFSVGWDAVELTSACIQLSGSMNANQYLAVDQSPGTPLTPCYTGINGAAVNDPCTNGNPNLRATTQGLFVGPVGGPASGDRVVPPSGSGGRGVCLALADQALSEITFYVEVVGISTPTAVHVHRGREGVNGPVEFPFLAPPAPGGSGRTETWDAASAAALEALEHGEYYIDVHTAAIPAGELRCQLQAASLIFADGFESGDTSAWTSTQPRT